MIAIYLRKANGGDQANYGFHLILGRFWSKIVTECGACKMVEDIIALDETL